MDELSEGTNCDVPASTSTTQDVVPATDPEREDGHEKGDEKETKQRKETDASSSKQTGHDLEQRDETAASESGEQKNENAVDKRATKRRKSLKLKKTKNKDKGRNGGEAKVEDDDQDSEVDTEDEQTWNMVTPEMIVETLGKNSHWRSSSTVQDIVSYLRTNFPVCQKLTELTVEVTHKLTCAEEIGLVIQECIADKRNADRIVTTYRLASPRERTYLSEWEVKEFWSHYREIVRRSKRQRRARYNARASRLRRHNGTAQSVGLRGKARRNNGRRQRRRSSHNQYSSDDSIECGRNCCCRK